MTTDQLHVQTVTRRKFLQFAVLGITGGMVAAYVPYTGSYGVGLFDGTGQLPTFTTL